METTGMNKNVTERKQPIKSLQSLKAVAFLLIFISHCVPAGIIGELGVSIFFTLSGFLMCYAYQEKLPGSTFRECIGFAFRKIRKLYPLHFITMLASVPLFWNALSDRKLWFAGLANVTLLQSWIPHSAFYFSYNAVAWYLSTSFFLYFLFPVLIRMIPDKKQNHCYIFRVILAYLLILFLGVLGNRLNPYTFSFSDNFTKWLNYIFPVSRVLNFYIGISLGYLFLNNMKRIKNIPTKNANLLLIAVLGVLLGTVMLYYSPIAFFRTDGNTSNALVTPGAVALLILFITNRDCLSKLLTNKVLLYIAKYSPQLFLIHRLVILYFNELLQFIGIQLPVLLQMGICLVLSLTLSVISARISAIRHS